MTHAQIGMDHEVHRKFIDEKPQPSNFKLKRFVDDVQPKTSTLRGDEKFMLTKTMQKK